LHGVAEQTSAPLMNTRAPAGFVVKVVAPLCEIATLVVTQAETASPAATARTRRI
jgi:hypothetical protein